MTLAETLQQKLSEWRPSGAGRHTWTEEFPEQGWTVHLAVDKNDSLSSLVWELTLARSTDAPVDATLNSWAKKLTGRVAGLMEELKLLEVDETRNEALIRSDDPTRKGDVIQFYEVRLTGTKQAIVRRFKADTAANTRREQLAFALTHETLANLVDKITR